MGRVDSAVGRVRSVNVGTPREAPWAGIGRTSIDKAPVSGPVEVGLRGVAGDRVSDTRHHGGRDKAVYAFAREQLDWWAEQLGDPLRDGEFGENLTVEGYDVDAAEIGERWQIGSVLLEVASVRTPCNDFRTWMGRGGHDNRGWVKRFAQHAHPGPYLRVLEPGTLSAGDDLVVVHRPGHGVSVEVMFRALVGEPELLPRLLAVDGLVEEARQRAESFAAGPGMIR